MTYLEALAILDAAEFQKPLTQPNALGDMIFVVVVQNEGLFTICLSWAGEVLSGKQHSQFSDIDTKELVSNGWTLDAKFEAAYHKYLFG